MQPAGRAHTSLEVERASVLISEGFVCPSVYLSADGVFVCPSGDFGSVFLQDCPSGQWVVYVSRAWRDAKGDRALLGLQEGNTGLALHLGRHVSGALVVSSKGSLASLWSGIRKLVCPGLCLPLGGSVCL